MKAKQTSPSGLINMTDKRKAGRPKAEPTEVIRIRLPLPVHAKVIERGGDKWVKRLINEAIEQHKEVK